MNQEEKEGCGVFIVILVVVILAAMFAMASLNPPAAVQYNASGYMLQSIDESPVPRWPYLCLALIIMFLLTIVGAAWRD
jgi:hypothetical protein